MFKKAQGMSINTIIIAIIVLVVLVVLVMIFTGYFGGWTLAASSCQSQGGTCNTGNNCLSGTAAPTPLPTDYVSPKTGRCYGADGRTVDATNVCCPVGATAVTT